MFWKAKKREKLVNKVDFDAFLGRPGGMRRARDLGGDYRSSGGKKNKDWPSKTLFLPKIPEYKGKGKNEFVERVSRQRNERVSKTKLFFCSEFPKAKTKKKEF